jgi:hypothetical protein
MSIIEEIAWQAICSGGQAVEVESLAEEQCVAGGNERAVA